MSVLFVYSLIVLALIFSVGRNLPIFMQLVLALVALVTLNGPTLWQWLR